MTTKKSTILFIIVMTLYLGVGCVDAVPQALAQPQPPLPQGVVSWLAIVSDIAEIAVIPLIMLIWNSHSKLRRELRDEFNQRMTDINTSKHADHTDIYAKINAQTSENHKLEIFIRDNFVQRRELKDILNSTILPVERSLSELRALILQQRSTDQS